jgi:site-specific DNA-cytosine methylase
MQSVAFAEVFAGISLMRAALTPLGRRCVFANDIDSDEANTYRVKSGADDSLVEDIKKVCAEQLSDLGLVTACFPYIDLSLAGNRALPSGQDSDVLDRTCPFSSLGKLHRAVKIRRRSLCVPVLQPRRSTTVVRSYEVWWPRHSDTQ